MDVTGFPSQCSRLNLFLLKIFFSLMNFKLVVCYLPSVPKRSMTNPYLLGKIPMHGKKKRRRRKKKESHWELKWVTQLNIRVTGSPVIFGPLPPHCIQTQMREAALLIRDCYTTSSTKQNQPSSFSITPKAWVKSLISVFHTGPFHYHSENSEELRPPRNRNGRGCRPQSRDTMGEGWKWSSDLNSQALLLTFMLSLKPLMK